MTDESYQGSTNRETWALDLHLANTQTLYRWTQNVARDYLAGHPGAADYDLGEAIVAAVQDALAGHHPCPPLGVATELRMLQGEVGSFWRVDRREIGETWREGLEEGR